MEKVYTLTREQIAELCPSCAESMAARGIKAVKLRVDSTAGEVHAYTDDPQQSVELFARKGGGGFSEGLCNRFMPEPGFFTRCQEVMSKHTDAIEDTEGFCAALHKWCVGKWPGEKPHSRRKTVVKHKQQSAEATEDGSAMSDAEVASYSNVIRGVEIFRAGTHNGDTYTIQDLDDMVAAFRELDYVPALKIGHTEDKPGAPAYGWVKNLRRVGDKLYADFEDVHDSVLDAIRKRHYDRVSSEVYFNLKRAVKDGAQKLYRRALKAVALLGAEVPAVAGLKPLHQMQFAAEECEAVRVFEQQLSVPTESLLAALSERVQGLIQLVKEQDMAKNAEKIAELEQQVADFRAKMEELKKDSGKSNEELESDEEYRKLAQQAAEIAELVEQLRAEDAAEDQLAELQAQLDAARAREEAMKTELKTLSERMAAIETERRNAQIGERVRACKIPAFRPGLDALYSYALSHPEVKVKVFSEGKSEELDLGAVVDGFVAHINEMSDKLFKTLAYAGHAVRPDGSEEEDPSREVARRVEKFRADHPEVKTYEEALRQVLRADAELARRYRAAFAGHDQ